MPVTFLLDEHIPLVLVARLPASGVDAVHAISLHLRAASDEIVLTEATRQGRAVVTANIADFSPLAKVWADAERSHAGIVLVPPSRSSVGRLLRGLKILATSRDTLANCVVFLP